TRSRTSSPSRSRRTALRLRPRQRKAAEEQIARGVVELAEELVLTRAREDEPDAFPAVPVGADLAAGDGHRLALRDRGAGRLREPRRDRVERLRRSVELRDVIGPPER